MNSKLVIKLLSIIMCCCLFSSFLSSCSGDYNNEEAKVSETNTPSTVTEGMSFELNEDGKSYTITGVHNCSVNGVLTIPDQYNGLPVTRIGAVANGMGDQTKKLVLPDSIEVIEERAFVYSTDLESITFGNGIRIIGVGAFEGCTNLTEINIPSSVTYLGQRAFAYCSQLKKIVLSNNLQTVFSDTFLYCNLIENIEMSVSNTKYICKGNCLINTDTKSLILGCKNSIIPSDEGLLHIAAFAFAEREGLKNIAFPNTLKSIGNNAFINCTSLENIVIPNSVESIEANAFWGCTNINSVSIENDCNLQYIGNSAFGKCTSLAKVIIPNSIVKIGEDVFYDCQNLKGTEYNSAIYLGNDENPYVFLLETADREISSCTVHKNTKFILSLAFVNCKNLTSVNLPEGLLGIGGYAFAGCPIDNFTLPTTVNYLGEMLSGISVDGEQVKAPDYTVLTQYDNAYYVGSSQNPYMVLVRAVNTDIIDCKIHKDTQIIYSAAFAECNKLERVVFESEYNLIEIGEWAFSDCRKLNSLVIPNSVNSIGSQAFSYCELLTENENGILYIGDWAVDIDNTMLLGNQQEEITLIIRNGTTGILGGLSYLVDTSVSIVLPKSLKYIGESSFCNGVIDKIYYSDCKCNFDLINIDFGNFDICNAQVLYYSEEQPHYWHFVNGVPSEWE